MGKLTKTLGAVGVVAGAAYLAKEENREKVKQQVNKTIKKLKSSSDQSYIKNLGKPKDARDAEMVDEGAMTSVQYYNKLQENENTKSPS